MIAQHVEQRYLHDNCVPEVRALCQHHTHEQTAIRAAHDAEMLGGGHTAIDQVFGHGDEIIIDDLALGLQASLVPGGAELAAAADIGQHIRAALLQPETPANPRIGRAHGDLEAAIAIEQCRRRPVERDAVLVDDKVRDRRAITRNREMLLHLQAFSIKLFRQAFERADLTRADIITQQGIRRQEVLIIEEHRIGILVGKGDPGLTGRARQRQIRCRPAVHGRFDHHHLAAHILIDRQERRPISNCHAVHRLAAIWMEDQRHRRKLACAEEPVEIERDHIA